jgi:hypothetical protein
MLEILLEDTTIPKLFVGDTLQAIYEWRGCINAFNNLPKNTIFIEFYSTFRIGYPACNIIREKFNNCWMISKSKNKTIIEYDKTPDNKYTYLFRTWRNLLLTAQETPNIWIYNYDKQKNIIERLHNKLQNYKLTKEDELVFEDDLPAFLLKMTEKELFILLNNIENNLTNKNDSICDMYTIHSYKGLESNIIKLYNDIDIEKEPNLYYVALTRGKQNIIINNNIDSSNSDINNSDTNSNSDSNSNSDKNSNSDINYNIYTECKHNIVIKSVQKTGGVMEGKIIIKINGPKVTNKSKIIRLFASSIEESLIRISKYLQINSELLTLKKI